MVITKYDQIWRLHVNVENLKLIIPGTRLEGILPFAPLNQVSNRKSNIYSEKQQWLDQSSYTFWGSSWWDSISYSGLYLDRDGYLLAMKPRNNANRNSTTGWYLQEMAGFSQQQIQSAESREPNNKIMKIFY